MFWSYFNVRIRTYFNFALNLKVLFFLKQNKYSNIVFGCTSGGGDS